MLDDVESREPCAHLAQHASRAIAVAELVSVGAVGPCAVDDWVRDWIRRDAGAGDLAVVDDRRRLGGSPVALVDADSLEREAERVANHFGLAVVARLVVAQVRADGADDLDDVARRLDVLDLKVDAPLAGIRDARERALDRIKFRRRGRDDVARCADAVGALERDGKRFD